MDLKIQVILLSWTAILPSGTGGGDSYAPVHALEMDAISVQLNSWSEQKPNVLLHNWEESLLFLHAAASSADPDMAEWTSWSPSLGGGWVQVGWDALGMQMGRESGNHVLTAHC